MKCLIILVSLAAVINAAEIPVGEVTAKVPLVADKEKVTTPKPVAVTLPVALPVIAPVPVTVQKPHVVSDKDKPVVVVGVPSKKPVDHVIDHGEHKVTTVPPHHVQHGEHKVTTVPPHVQHVVDQVHQHVPQVISHHVSMIKSMHENVAHVENSQAHPHPHPHPDHTSTTSAPIPIHHGSDKVPHHGHQQHQPIHVDIIQHLGGGHTHTAHNVQHGSIVPTVPQAVVDKVNKVQQQIQQVMQQAHQHIPQLINQHIAQQKEKDHIAHHVPTTQHVPHVTPVSVSVPVESVQPGVSAIIHHPVVNVEKPVIV